MLHSMGVEITDRRDSIVVSASARTADDWSLIRHRVVLFFQRPVPRQGKTYFLVSNNLTLQQGSALISCGPASKPIDKASLTAGKTAGIKM